MRFHRSVADHQHLSDLTVRPPLCDERGHLALTFRQSAKLFCYGTTDEQRGRIMPVNKKYQLPHLLEICRNLKFKTRDRITWEYILIEGINDTDADALWLVVGAPPSPTASTLEMTPEELADLYPEGPKALPPELAA